MFRSAFGVFAAVVVACGLTSTPARAVPAGDGKTIDIAICLDVSGSMQGLVDSAKVKLWDIVNELARVKPTPNLRVALYSYGHQTYSPQSGWVRKEADLTVDLDEVYRKLNGLTINGGEEYVARVSKAALSELKWSDQKDALKIVFVCGNEPADQDKENTLIDVAKLAKEKGVIINTIYCNWGKRGEELSYKAFAHEAGGKFAMIDHNQRVVQIDTPYDKDLLSLNTKLNDTYLSFRNVQAEAKKDNQLKQDANAAGAGGQTIAGRVATKGGALYKNSEWCVVSRCIEDPKFDITKVPEAELPEELKKLKPAERVEYVKKKIAEREKVQKDISTVNEKRSKYLAEEMKKHAGAAEKQLDTVLKTILREQAATKGIKIPE